MKEYRYISADSHWSSAPQNWAERVPDRFFAPKELSKLDREQQAVQLA